MGIDQEDAWSTEAAESISSDRAKGLSPQGLGEQLMRVIAWSGTSSTGDRADLDFEPHPRVWAMLSTTARECPGAYRCPSGDACFAERARSLAAEARVVVVNTHLYAAHVASDGAVLPEHDLLVIDEAHEAEDVFAASLGAEVTPGRFRALAASSRGLTSQGDTREIDRVADLSDRFEAALRPLAGKRVLAGAGISPGGAGTPPGGAGTSPGGAGTSASPLSAQGDDGVGGGPPGIERSLTDPGPAASRTRAGAPGRAAESAPRARQPALDGLVELLELARNRVETLGAALRRAEASGPPGDLTADARARRARALQAGSHLGNELGALLSIDESHVAWVETTGAGGRSLALRVAPVYVGDLLAEKLWPHVSATLTSATIPPRLAERLGMPPELTDEVRVPSPFPYRQNALLYCAAHLPDPRTQGFEARVHDEIRSLVEAAGGRTLALFTSWRAMRATVEALAPRLEYPVLAQGDLPKARLVEAFSSEEEACLFATMSFWQGVDVPGATLSLVVIDRIPFPRPDDPLFQARREHAGTSAFRVVDLPRAAALLAQGAGRLIRRKDDRGVVAVLDSRLAKASYRKLLLDALPPMRRTTDPAEAYRLLAACREAATSGEPANASQ